MHSFYSNRLTTTERDVLADRMLLRLAMQLEAAPTEKARADLLEQLAGRGITDPRARDRLVAKLRTRAQGEAIRRS